MLTRLFLSIMAIASSSAFTPTAIFQTHTRLMMAAPGISIASQAEVEAALSNPRATLVDARSVEEMRDSGYVDNQNCRFVCAPATKTDAPLLEVAAASLIPSKSDPVVIYCGSGIRAETSKKVLEDMGYTNVLNAGGLSDVEYLKD